MSARSIILIAAALLLTIGTIFVARSWLAANRQTAAPVAKAPVKTMVLVARTDLPTGTFVNEQHLRWQTWPDSNLPENYLLKGRFDEKGLYGAVVRRSFTAGQPIVRSQVVKPGDRGFLAAVLKPGFRAYSINVTATTSIAGLVFPGDRVDLLLAHSLGKGRGGQKVSETVLTNLRVLAIDQSVNDQAKKPRVGKTVTFEVTPKQAEILAVVSGLGRLSLSLRSLAKDKAEMKRLVNSEDPLEEPAARMGRTYTRGSEASVLMGFSGTGVSVVRGGKKKKEKVEE